MKLTKLSLRVLNFTPLVLLCSVYLSSMVSSLAFAEEPVPTIPESYEVSRQKFRARCKSQSLECGSWKIPSKIDMDLTVDFAHRRVPEAKKILVLVSGIHGVEGPIGSAILEIYQNSVMKTLAEKGISSLLVHSFNPFGFKYHRRVSEQNIDLNRNFPSPGLAPYQVNQGYAKLRKNLEPAGPTSSVSNSFAGLSSNLIFQLLLRRFTLSEMHDAVAGGQREYELGMFYGGKSPEPQIPFLQELLTKEFAGMAKVLVMDLHTGLGKKGVLHVMPSNSPSEASTALRQNIFAELKVDEPVKVTFPKSTGYYRVSGGFLEFAEALAKPGQSILALTAEFGTLGDDILNQLRSLNRMVQENQGNHFGYSSPQVKTDVIKNFRELFSPTSPEWQNLMGQQTLRLFSLIEKNF